MREDQPTFIRRDRRGRVFMAPGPMWWWIAGLCLIVAAGAAPIVALSPGDPLRRWVGIIFALVLIGYFVLALKVARSRWKSYRAELTRRGFQHGQPMP